MKKIKMELGKSTTHDPGFFTIKIFSVVTKGNNLKTL